MKIYFLKEFLIEQQIKNKNYEINEEIYKLYDLTKKEQEVIEKS